MRKAQPILLLLWFCFSCGESPFYASYQETPSGWNHQPPLSFAIDEFPSTPSNLYIHVRNNEAYRYANIFLIGSIYQGDSLYLRDTLEYAMAEPSGKYLGTGYGSVKESKLWWKSQWTAPETGRPYRVEVQQLMRENGVAQGLSILEGVVAVGLSVEPVNVNAQ